MTKSKRQIMADIGLCDVVLELLDARIPNSSRNPDIIELASGKKHIVILNKADLANPNVTSLWEKFFNAQGIRAISATSNTSKTQTTVIRAAEEMMKERNERLKNRGRLNPVTRTIVLGIPNVGKSTLINQYAKRTAAAAANRPGVTRGKQWINVNPTFTLLDTPGILWPKIDDEAVTARLALTGAIKETRIDVVLLACYGLYSLMNISPEILKQRYKIELNENEPELAMLEKLGAARGYVLPKGVIDLERAATALVKEFRDGVLGRISLEKP